MARHSRDDLTVEANFAVGNRTEPGDGLEGGALPGAIGTDQRHNLALVYLKRDASDGFDFSVVDVYVIQFKKHPPALPNTPRSPEDSAVLRQEALPRSSARSRARRRGH